MHTPDDVYALYYWDGLPGRGEYVRLVLEAVGAPYVDVTRLPKEEGGGHAPMFALLRGEGPGLRPLAPPVLVHDGRAIAQTANICAYLAARHGLVPDDPGAQAEALQLALTISDLVTETHDTHHPIAKALYYEDQKVEARRYAERFVAERLPKFLRYFEAVAAANRDGGVHLLGDALTYVDLSMFQTLEGLAYAFPRALARIEGELPRLMALRGHVAALPRIAAYRASPRCRSFNEHGIFRRYPELDGEPAPAS
ncbi:MAG: glutathione S-transferase [Nannocystaceae bacterium]